MSFTYGELRPQIFRSRAATQRVAWRIGFKRTWYGGVADIPGAGTPGINLRSTAGKSMAAVARAGGSAQIGAVAGRSQQAIATGGVGALTNEAGILLVYVPADGGYKPLAPFDRRDVLFTNPTLAEHVRSWIAGRGW